MCFKNKKYKISLSQHPNRKSFEPKHSSNQDPRQPISCTTFQTKDLLGK